MSLDRGSRNVINDPLVHPSKVLLPLLHIKLGLMKQFVQALDKEEYCFQYIMSQFFQFSDAKLKKGIFDGPQNSTAIKRRSFCD